MKNIICDRCKQNIENRETGDDYPDIKTKFPIVEEKIEFVLEKNTHVMQKKIYYGLDLCDNCKNEIVHVLINWLKFKR